MKFAFLCPEQYHIELDLSRCFEEGFENDLRVHVPTFLTDYFLSLSATCPLGL